MAFYKVSLDTWKKFNEQKDDKIPTLNINNYMRIVKPKRSTMYSAGYDFYLPFDIDLKAGESIVVPTGIKARLPEKDQFLAIYPRSSLGFKSNEGHYLIAFTVEKDMKLPVGTKFCQGIIQRYCLMEDDDADGTRTGGVGSTGL